TTLIFIIVGIIIMNTLIINVNERYYEIGTMRAIGASKAFIRNMFISESLMVNLTGFIAGVIISLPFILYFQKFGLTIPKMVAEVLLGGGKLYLIFSFSSIIMGFILILLVSIAATYYPIRLATKIPPVKAMSEKL
ncbi:MAG: ABC transporter permease, partial [Exilispira sp.]